MTDARIGEASAPRTGCGRAIRDHSRRSEEEHMEKTRLFMSALLILALLLASLAATALGSHDLAVLLHAISNELAQIQVNNQE
jgi:uncharacterized membrane protein